jgi:NADH-quinone oxidoreductase subunit J
MTAMQVIFLLNALATVFAAVMVVTARRLMHAGLWLVLTLLGVAVVFGLLEASFFVIIQIVVYVGAIAILIIFAIMLTRDAVDDTFRAGRRWITTGVVAVLALTGILLAMTTWPSLNSYTVPLSADQQSISELGKALVDPNGYAIPFEVSSVLLLAALVGAVYVAVERKGEQP